MIKKINSEIEIGLVRELIGGPSTEPPGDAPAILVRKKVLSTMTRSELAKLISAAIVLRSSCRKKK